MKKGIDYVLSWKQKGAYNSKFKPLYTAFLYSIKLCGYRIRIKFDKDGLGVEQSNYLFKIVNAYILHESYIWSWNTTNKLNFKNCLFEATSVVKIVIKKSMCIVAME